jgi:DNA invertase Pin-like site-specific DNA recombinase
MNKVSLPLAAYVVVDPENHERQSRQANAIRSWGTKSNVRLTWILDEIDEDGSLDQKDGLRAALQLVKWRKVSGMVIESRGVFGPDLVQQELVLDEIERAGGSLVELSPPAEDASSRRDLIRRTIHLVRSYDSVELTDRLRSGRATKAVRGGYAYGAPAYGYRSEKGELRPRDEEQVAIKLMLDLREEGLSYRAIAERLSEERFKPKRGKTWHPEAVRRVVQRALAAA